MGSLQLKNKVGKTIQFPEGADLKRAISEKYGTKAADNASSYHFRHYLGEQGVTRKDVLRALGYDNVKNIQVRELLENDGTKPLFNSIVEDGLRIGFERDSNWQQLVAETIPTDQFSYLWYYLDTGATPEEKEEMFGLRDVGQGAPIPTGSIKVGENSIKMSKRGRGLEWTDESKRANISLVSLWLRQLGRQLGRQYEGVAVNRLLNGYFADGTDAAPTVGVANAGSWDLSDIFYAAAYQEETLGYRPNRAIMNLETAYRITTMRDGDAYLYRNEIENNQFADVLNNKPFISEQIPDNRIVLVDTSAALVRYQGKAFGVESDRNVKTQVEGSYGTEISEFVPFIPEARIIMTLDEARPATT
ncbi:hypothetical protein P4661_27325 [Priestia megaterium]|uniref:phage major capsid protein n=1 Tax=Priestia megaterium TaxID=1404 RepID=UPI002E1B144B|nr:hypothetical protein [Priestia megaterium]